jgi:FKBP-type peptidyl-prolyl cis-trans isomerase 2
LTFVEGSRAVIPGFEKAAAGLKKAGETVKVTLKPEDAYGI